MLLHGCLSRKVMWREKMTVDIAVALVVGFLVGGISGVLLISIMLMVGRDDDGND